jgi:hypothetical protein
VGLFKISNTHSTGAITEIALSAATVKTVLQVVTPATQDLRVVQWGIYFDGTSATAEPVLVSLIDTTGTAATVTSYTPDIWDTDSLASLCVGGTTSTGINASGEGTLSTTRVFEALEVPPTSGFLVQYPLGREPAIPASHHLRLRANAPGAVNCTAQIVWQE